MWDWLMKMAWWHFCDDRSDPVCYRADKVYFSRIKSNVQQDQLHRKTYICIKHGVLTILQVINVFYFRPLLFQPAFEDEAANFLRGFVEFSCSKQFKESNMERLAVGSEHIRELYLILLKPKGKAVYVNRGWIISVRQYGIYFERASIQLMSTNLRPRVVWDFVQMSFVCRTSN